MYTLSLHGALPIWRARCSVHSPLSPLRGERVRVRGESCVTLAPHPSPLPAERGEGTYLLALDAEQLPCLRERFRLAPGHDERAEVEHVNHPVRSDAHIDRTLERVAQVECRRRLWISVVAIAQI